MIPEWITVVVLLLSTGSSVLAWWEARVRRQAVRETSSDKDSQSLRNRISVVDKKVAEDCERIDDVAQKLGELKFQTDLRYEEWKRDRDRLERDNRSIWHAIQELRRRS